MIKDYIFYVLLASLALVGCSPSPEETKPANAQEIVDSLAYVKSKAGPCYGVATTSKLSSAGSYSLSVSIVPADCNLVPK